MIFFMVHLFLGGGGGGDFLGGGVVDWSFFSAMSETTKPRAKMVRTTT
jgi:hypothetical protein